MQVDDVIELNNQKKYKLLKEINDNNDKYFLAVALDNEEHVIDTDLVLFKAILQNNEIFVDIVDDQDLIIKLMGD